MEKRDRDKVSHSTKPTEAGKVNREVASRRGQEEHIEPVDFGQNIGESEFLEPKRNEPDSSESKDESSSDSGGRAGSASSSSRKPEMNH